ncbi:MAG: Ig-like domain-containing protein, partial [Chloroflexota bacterium]
TVVTVNDTNLDVDFLPEVQNPSLKGIEIVQLEAFSNVPPTITEIADLTLSETQTETITFDVSDLEGDAVTVNFINLPGFVTEETPTTDAGVTTYTLTVAPQASDAGTYPVQVIASDGTEVTEDFTITVEDFVNTPPTITAIDDLTLFETQTRTVTFDVADIDGDDVTVSVTDLSFVSGGANAGAGTYTLTIAPADGDAGTYPVMVTASDGVEVTETFNITVEDNDIPAGTVLYRVNVGGPQLDAEDGSSPVWSKDQGQFGTANNSPYLIANSTGGSIYNGNNGSAHGGSIVMTDPSIPASAPPALFNLERYNNQTNNPAGQQWEFPVVEGTDVVVRLFFAELFGGVSAPGERVFDVFVEDEVPPTFDDIDQIAIAGPKGAFMREATVTVGSDGILNIVMLSSVENPALKGIEIAIPDQLDSPVNTAPVAVADSYTTDQNVPLTVDAANGVLANDTDTENDTLTAIATGGAAGGGTLTLNADGSFTYTPPSSSFTGDATFFYKANDGELDSSDAAITITVTPNAFPVAESDSYTTFVNQDLLVEAPGIFANDSDDTVSLGLVSEQDIKTKGGSLILGAGGPGGFLLEVPQDYTGTLTWQYVPQDERGANGRGNIVTVTIEVLPAPNVAPVADAGADIT